MNELELEEMNRSVIADFRANGGEVGGQHAFLDILLWVTFSVGAS